MERGFHYILIYRKVRKKVEILEHKTYFQADIPEGLRGCIHRLAIFCMEHIHAVNVYLSAVCFFKLVYTAQKR